MNAAERFVDQKIDSAVAGQIADFGYRHPTCFLRFHSGMRQELRPVYRGVLIVACPFLHECFEKSDVEGKHLFRVGPCIRTFIGYVA